jgi:uncharacterized protein (TIGR02285 family)
MMRKIILAIVVVAFFPFANEAAEVVSWLTTNNPPSFIYSGEFAGQGIGDQAIEMIAKQLPGFEHRIVKASPARIWYEMEHSDGMCSFGALYTPEREKIIIFSDRPFVLPGYRMFIKADRLDDFRQFMTDDGEIDLDLLGKSVKLVGAHVASRLYLRAIDNFIKDPARKTTLEKLPEAQQILSLLYSGRIDFGFMSELEHGYYARAFPSNAKLLTLPVKDSPRRIAPYLFCSKGPLGQAVIDAANRLLNDDRHWSEFLAPIRQWVAPTDFAAALAAKPHRPDGEGSNASPD